jgi:hypothetical protein
MTQLINIVKVDQFIRLSSVFTFFTEFYYLRCETLTVMALLSEDLDADGRSLKCILNRKWIELI